MEYPDLKQLVLEQYQEWEPDSFIVEKKSNGAALYQEMRRMGSLIMACADKHQVPAGGALAVDREGFAGAVTAAIEAEELIQIVREEIQETPPSDWNSATLSKS